MAKRIITIALTIVIALGMFPAAAATPVMTPAVAAATPEMAHATAPVMATTPATAPVPAYQTETRAVQPLAATLTASPTAATVIFDGKSIAFDAYNINGNNYFKLRDLAYTINGTPKQFEAGWDGANNAITLTSGMAYTPNNSEMVRGSGGNKTPTPTNSVIYLDGRTVAFTAYNIEGSNYFKLREVAMAFNFSVTWDAASQTIIADTSKDYTTEDGGPLTLGDLFDTSAPIPVSRMLEYYDLTAEELQLYYRFATCIENYELSLDVPNMSIDSCYKVDWILHSTRPDLFWWPQGDNIEYVTYNDKIFLILPKYYTGNEMISSIVTIDPNLKAGYKVDYPSSTLVNAGKAWVERTKPAITNALRGIPVRAGMSPYELELAIHDWLIENVRIQDIRDPATGEEILPQVRLMSEAVLNHRANCVGFSTTFRYIMNMLGIECLARCGYDQTGDAHQWNAVRLGGEWYNVDVTKDRAYLVSDYSNYAHYFFNCTDKRLTDYRYVFGLKYCVNPNITCTATRYSYDNMSM